MECHKYLVVALTHAIYPKLTPLLRARRKTESHAIAKTQASYNSLQKYEQKIPCAMLISEADLRQIQSSTTPVLQSATPHILLHHQILRTRWEGDPGSASGTPFPFLPPDPSAGPKTDATRMHSHYIKIEPWRIPRQAKRNGTKVFTQIWDILNTL